MNISKAMREVRLSSGLNQKEIAAKLKITQTYVSLIENGHKIPSLEVIEAYGNVAKFPLAIVLWKAIDEKDVAQNKKKIFRELKPTIDKFISEFF